MSKKIILMLISLMLLLILGCNKTSSPTASPVKGTALKLMDGLTLPTITEDQILNDQEKLLKESLKVNFQKEEDLVKFMEHHLVSLYRDRKTGYEHHIFGRIDIKEFKITDGPIIVNGTLVKYKAHIKFYDPSSHEENIEYDDVQIKYKFESGWNLLVIE
jgi:hypothetical protein